MQVRGFERYIPLISYRDIHVYVYRKYSDTLNTFNMLRPLNKAKVISKGSS